MGKKILVFVLSVISCLSAKGQEMALSTNVLGYADLGTLNVGASYAVKRHFSLGASARYNPFTFNEGEDNELFRRQRSAALAARYWPWYVFSGWWMEAYVRGEEYSYGNMVSRYSKDGDRIGGGLAFGYSWMLGRHFDLELGAGMWSGSDRYVIYECPQCGRIVEEGRKVFFRPDDIILSLTYVF